MQADLSLSLSFENLNRASRNVPLASPGRTCDLAPPPFGAIFRGGLAAWQKRTVAEHIEHHLAECIPLRELAGLARLSPYHFSRAFKQSFGAPPHRYHLMRRIERAKAWLASTLMSVTEIGLALGFADTSAFSATFHKLTGFTPSAFLRSHRDPANSAPMPAETCQ